MTIRVRLLLVYVVVVGVSSLGLLWWITSATRLRYLESMEESLVDTSVILASFLEKQVVNQQIDAAAFRDAFATAYHRQFDARIYALHKTAVDLRVYVTDRRGIVLYDSDGGKAEGHDYSQWRDVLLTLQGRYGARATRIRPDDESTVVIHVAAPIRAPDGAIAGVVTVGKPTTYINELVSTNRRRVATYGAVIAVALVGIGWLATVWLTRPLARLTAHVRALRDGRQSTPPDLSGVEVRALGHALEEMRDALDGKDYVENYVQALTHQIKAPLAAVRGASELLLEDVPADDRRRFLTNIRTETDRIQRIVDRLLELSALEKRKGLENVELLDLAGQASAAIEELRPALAARGLTVRQETSPDGVGPKIAGEKFLVRQAILNLVHNAIEFSPRGSEIGVSVSADGGCARLEVLDQGPGVPGYALPRVFERFYSLPRPDTGAKGSGLGLSFVQEIAHLHGGTARLENRHGGGARAMLEFPEA
jgi:two-component system sensor histidine kinase CreC